MTGAIWAAAAIAGIVSLLAPLAARPVLRRYGVFDTPNARSSHSTPTLRGGGIGVLLGFASGLAAAALAPVGVGGVDVIIVILASASAAALIGLVEDIRGIPVAARAGLQLIVALLAALALQSRLDAPWWGVVLGAVMVAGYVNVTNFMDGIDGISALHGLTVGATFAAIGVLTGLSWLSLVGGVIAAAFLAFLPWNLARPGLFLGDVGSYLLGAAIAVTALAAMMAGLPPVAMLAPLAVYLADAGFTLVTRVLRKERWYEPHRTHVYQRLTDFGLSHLAVAGIVTVTSLASGALGIWYLFADVAGRWMAVSLIVVCVLAYLSSPRWLRAPREVGGRR